MLGLEGIKQPRKVFRLHQIAENMHLISEIAQWNLRYIWQTPLNETSQWMKKMFLGDGSIKKALSKSNGTGEGAVECLTDQSLTHWCLVLGIETSPICTWTPKDKHCLHFSLGNIWLEWSERGAPPQSKWSGRAISQEWHNNNGQIRDAYNTQ